MSSQGTIRLKVINGSPSVDKLWNNRYRLEFLCDNNSPKEDWYYDNIASILPDYGVLQDADFGSGVSEGWEAISGSVYPDMRLTETQYTYISSIGDKRVILTYETLTSSWVEEKAEDTDYELNGLKRVSRTFVALPATAYDKVVGTSTIDSGGTTLYLGGFKIEKTESKWELSETWFEAGIVSRASIDSADGSEVQQITTYLAVEGSAVGPITRREVRSIEGLPTYTITETLSSDGTSIISEDPKLINQKASIKPFPVPGLIRLRNSSRQSFGYNYNAQTINYSFDLHGPIDAACEYTTYEFIQTEPSLQATDYTYSGARGLWAPGGWARSRVSGVDASHKPFSVAKAYRGYRAPENLLSFSQTSSTGWGSTGYWSGRPTRLVSLEGDPINTLYIDGYEMSTNVSPVIELGGGPENPVGNTYVTNVEINPYFTDSSGVPYYKKRITTVYVDADRVDDADTGDVTNNRLGSYTTTSEGDGNYSIEIDETLFSSDDDFYTGAWLEVYARDKDSRNKFKSLQLFPVYDYDSASNKLLINGDINTGETVGLYSGSGDLGVNSNYDFSRISLIKYATTGIISRIWNARTIIHNSDVRTNGGSYIGWTLLITSGVDQGSLYTITGSNLNRLNFATNSPAQELDTFELIPPQSF